MPDAVWMDGEQWLVTDQDPEIGLPYSAGGPILHLRYGDGSVEEEAKVCNRKRVDGVVCRVWKDHPGPCIPFAVELAIASGVIVDSIEE